MTIGKKTAAGRLLSAIIILGGLATNTAAAFDLSQERCNVFVGPACMVLPRGMSLNFDAPADYERYRFISKGTVILSAYVQNFPAKVEASLSFNKKVGGVQVKGYKSSLSGKSRIDVVFIPDAKPGPAVHVYADVSDGLSKDAAVALAGIRICQRQSMEELSCPLHSELGPDLAGWLLNK